MKRALLVALLLTGGLRICAYAGTHPYSARHRSDANGQDTRQEVIFPPLDKRRTLAAMRMHLQGLSAVQQALAEGHFDQAAQIATMSLGMSSMHGSQETDDAKIMPPGMLKLGALMHRRAEEFAVAAQNAAMTGDVRKPLKALSQVTQACVACHATYRLR
ncbi:MAG: hypothetical protein ACYDDA_16010 [Acidiferrobacteraceae bacterium]